MARTFHTRTGLPPGFLAKHYDGFLTSLRRVRPETRGTYGRALREFVRWFPPDRGGRITTADVERYKRHLTNGKQLSAVSVSTYLTALRRFCGYLVRRNVIQENPALPVGGNSRPRVHSRSALSRPEVEILLSVVDRSDERGLRDYAFIKLMLGSALSEIEIIRADAGDRIVSPSGVKLRVQGKGRIRKDQAVLLAPDVAAALDAYLHARPGFAPEDPLFASAGNRTRGERMTTRGVRDRVTHYLVRAGLKGEGPRRISPYSLRHTAALLMAGDGASADEIRDRMRLGSLATAMLYINQSKEQLSGS
jgi:site-specific recombinase XerD